MAVLKCKMCGGELNLSEGASTAECEYCGSVQTVPKADDEKKLNLFVRANRLRAACEFDKAAGVYEAIVADFPEEAEAYWGLVLCKYGIEYVDDPATGKKIPTCHRSAFESVMKDANVELAQEYADVLARRLYREEAKQIEDLRKNIIAVSANEEPYDVFICYKETDFDGKRTLDSVLAQDIYDALTDKDYRVFFSRISLEDKLGTEFEPYIFAALNSAKIMLVIGTDFEYFNAVWVKNEWSRFLKLMVQDKSKHLIPCYKGIDAYDMPEEFARLQAQDLDKMGAIQDIVRGVQKLLPKTVKETVMVQQAAPATDPLLERAFMFLEDGDWRAADEYCEKVLDINPKCARAYLGKLMAEMKVSATEQLTNAAGFCETNNNYKKLLRFADESLKATLESCLHQAKIKAEQRASRETMEADFNRNAIIEDGVLIEYTGEAKEIYIPNSVTSIGGGAFFCCETLTAITIGNSVTSIEDEAFFCCETLTAITIGNSVTSIGEKAFSHCEALTAITIGNSVTSIGRAAFESCYALTTINIPASVTQLGVNPFMLCRSKLQINVAEGNKNYRVIDGHLVDVRTKTLISGNPDKPIPADGNVEIIGDCAFNMCLYLTDITIPKCVTHIGNGAFSHCRSLTSIAIPDSVTSIGTYAFSWCEELTAITIADSVTSIGENSFQYCDKISIIAPLESYAWKWAKEHGITVKEDEKTRRTRIAAQQANREKKERIAASRRLAGLCQHCGGQMKGLFSKKCVSCGKPKDY